MPFVAIKILFFCEDFPETSFASDINLPRARRRPDFAKLRRGQPSVFFTPRPGAPKRSDGGLVLEKAFKPYSILDGEDSPKRTQQTPSH